ncbi:MAG: Spy/CpxP family protein refolding chaperone [Vampirovibrionales bacterium]|nr:Spy/CpxP family protein refolding chaperone [Vampirovibrionales bacterium]
MINAPCHRFFKATLLTATAAILLGLLGVNVGWANSALFYELDLTPQQTQSMQKLDDQWQGSYSQLQPQIEQDQTTLKRLIQAPSANSEQVMHVQNRLQRNRDALHQSATRIFMEKKERLTPEQRQRLHKMMDR